MAVESGQTLLQYRLAEKIGEPASSLSGGQQQMLALARAMITRPRLLMIDELSFGLSRVKSSVHIQPINKF